ncbi:Tn3 family transposase [Streptomyces sp. NPDC056716]|uniref:Tn3 family transposase n=1 Tax=unclassified Streptomyces TaxID=2593676 RepID=UPI0036C32510
MPPGATGSSHLPACHTGPDGLHKQICGPISYVPLPSPAGDWCGRSGGATGLPLGAVRGPAEESQEVSMLALHLLQSALVHVNTLLMQEVLADPRWADKLTDADRRALSPLFWTHVNPYGRFELDMNSRLDLNLTARALARPRPRGPQAQGAAAQA